jgi:hypothetical protein
MLESGLTDFIGQIPSQLYLLLCGSGALLVLAVGLMTADRRRRAKRARALAGAGPRTDVHNHDLPELDVLTTPAPAVERSAPMKEAAAGAESAVLAVDATSAAAVPSPNAAAAEPPPGSMRTLRLNSGEDVQVIEALRIYRDITEGGLVIEIGEARYRYPSSQTDVEYRRRLSKIVRELGRGLPDPETAAVAPPAPAEVSLPAPATPPAPSAPPPAAAAAAAAVLPAEPIPGDLPRFRMPDTIEPPRRGRRRHASEPIPEINIAAAIEAFLQYRLPTSPLAGRSIHVLGAPGGGLNITVDGRAYEAVSEVDDGEVRAYLQAIIEEWQARQ